VTVFFAAGFIVGFFIQPSTNQLKPFFQTRANIYFPHEYRNIDLNWDEPSYRGVFQLLVLVRQKKYSASTWSLKVGYYWKLKNLDSLRFNFIGFMINLNEY